MRENSMSKFFVYYNSETGKILSLSGEKISAMKDKPFIKVEKEIAVDFLSGKKTLAQWMVDSKEKILKPLKAKQDFAEKIWLGNFYAVPTRRLKGDVWLSYDKKKKTMEIFTEEKKMFYLTKPNNPTYLLQAIEVEGLSTINILEYPFTIFTDKKEDQSITYEEKDD